MLNVLPRCDNSRSQRWPEAESVTPEERDEMFALCAQIAVENDPQKFNTLVQKLNDLLESKEPRLDDASKNP
jgi:hypothetical protein